MNTKYTTKENTNKHISNALINAAKALRQMSTQPSVTFRVKLG